jgi:DNA-binding transcriptional LysR family regulator
VPAFLSKHWIDSGVLKPILQDHPLLSGGLFALYPVNRHLAHRVRVLIDYLKACFADTPVA